MIGNDHRQGKGRGLYPGSLMDRQKRLFLRSWIMLVAMTVLPIVTVGVAQADDQPIPAMAVGYQNGTITAVHQTTFQIDERTYSLTPDAVIFDESGNQIDAGYIAVQIEAKFHVKKEQSDKIDKMILTLPR